MTVRLILVMGACVVGCLIAIANAEDSASYPNPRTEPSKCGSTAKSWMCDNLDIVVNTTVVDGINSMITDIHSLNQCACSDCSVGDYPDTYIKVAVAVLRDVPRQDSSAQDSDYDVMMTFASHLRADRWRYGGDCGDDVILVLAANKHMVVASSGEAAIKEKLSVKCLNTIIGSNNNTLQKKQFGHAIYQILEGIKNALSGKHYCQVPVTTPPPPAEDEALISTTVWIIIGCVGGLVVLGVILCCWCITKRSERSKSKPALALQQQVKRQQSEVGWRAAVEDNGMKRQSRNPSPPQEESHSSVITSYDQTAHNNGNIKTGANPEDIRCSIIDEVDFVNENQHGNATGESVRHGTSNHGSTSICDSIDVIDGAGTDEVFGSNEVEDSGVSGGEKHVGNVSKRRHKTISDFRKPNVDCEPVVSGRVHSNWKNIDAVRIPKGRKTIDSAPVRRNTSDDDNNRKRDTVGNRALLRSDQTNEYYSKGTRPSDDNTHSKKMHKSTDSAPGDRMRSRHKHKSVDGYRAPITSRQRSVDTYQPRGNWKHVENSRHERRSGYGGAAPKL